MNTGDLIIITYRDGFMDFAVLEGVSAGRLRVRSVGSEISRTITDPKRITLLLHRS